MMLEIHGVEVSGLEVDPLTRCGHYHSELDVIAIRFACCDRYYPCYECHLAVADHPPTPWPANRFDETAVLCGACGLQMTVTEYQGASACPRCTAGFNPGCKSHWHLYFEVA